MLVNKNMIVKFLMDSGAQCNVISKRDYESCTNRNQRTLKKTNIRLKTYGGFSINPLGETWLHCNRNGNKKKLKFLVVNNECSPILGVDACQQMKFIKFIDSDMNEVRKN